MVNKGKCPVVGMHCEHYRCLHDRNDDVAIEFCNHPENRSDKEGNCTTTLCPFGDMTTATLARRMLEAAQQDNYWLYWLFAGELFHYNRRRYEFEMRWLTLHSIHNDIASVFRVKEDLL